MRGTLGEGSSRDGEPQVRGTPGEGSFRGGVLQVGGAPGEGSPRCWHILLSAWALALAEGREPLKVQSEALPPSQGIVHTRVRVRAAPVPPATGAEPTWR